MEPQTVSMLATPPWRLLTSVRPWIALLYLACGAVLAMPTMLCLLVFPLLPAWAQLLSEIEVRRAAFVLDGPRGWRASWRTWSWRAMAVRARAVASWRQAALTAMHAAVALLTMPLVVLWTVLGVGAFRIATGAGVTLIGNERHLVLDSPVVAVPVALLLFVVVLAVLASVTWTLAVLWAWTVTALSGGRDVILERQVELLSGANVAMSAAFETERRRIERDIHDGPQQHLAIVAMHIGLARADVGGGEAGVAIERLDRALDELDVAADALRVAVRDLRPRVLVEEGLAAAVADMARRSAVPVTVTSGDGVRAPAQVESALMFVVSEFVTNAHKHARAREVLVAISATDDEVRLELSDDGVGGADPALGTGLSGMAQRVRALGGTWSWSSPPGGGTRVLIACPVADAGWVRPAVDAGPRLARDVGRDEEAG